MWQTNIDLIWNYYELKIERNWFLNNFKNEKVQLQTLLTINRTFRQWQILKIFFPRYHYHSSRKLLTVIKTTQEEFECQRGSFCAKTDVSDNKWYDKYFDIGVGWRNEIVFVWRSEKITNARFNVLGLSWQQSQ